MEKGIWKMPVQGGEVAQVTGPIKDPFTYYITADGIFYSAPVDIGNPIRPLDACTYETCPLILLADFAYPNFVPLLLIYASLPFSPYPCTLILCASCGTDGGNPRPSPTTGHSYWKTFLSNHAGDIIGIDFFTVPTATFRNLYCFIILLHERRQVVHFNVTEHPTSAWTAQQMIEAFPEDTGPRFLLQDRDSIYGNDFRRRVTGMQIEEVITAPHSPWQNDYASHYTSSVLSALNDFARSLSRNFWPCALTGGFGPGSSYKRAFLSS